MTELEVATLFYNLVADVEQKLGFLNVELEIGHAHLFPNNRNYAFCTNPMHAKKFNVPKGCCLIVTAPKILKADRPRVLGLLMHELGHAIDFQKTPDHPNNGSERRADQLAEAIWRVPIRYDAETIQSTCCGVHPRPSHLGL